MDESNKVFRDRNELADWLRSIGVVDMGIAPAASITYNSRGATVLGVANGLHSRGYHRPGALFGAPRDRFLFVQHNPMIDLLYHRLQLKRHLVQQLAVLQQELEFKKSHEYVVVSADVVVEDSPN